MKKQVLKTSLLITTILFINFSFGQSKIWTPTSPGSLDNAVIKAPGAKYYNLDIESVKGVLENVPDKNSGHTGKTFHFPDEYGNIIQYKVFTNTTMSEGLQAKFPDIRTFDAINKEKSYFAKIDYTPHGFHAIVHRQGMPTLYIDPVFQGNNTTYIVYNRNQFTTTKTMDCQVQSTINTTGSPGSIIKSFGTCELRTYELAVAATGEYTDFHGGTLALAQAAQVTTINRVNSVYEIDIAITLTIIPNNDQIVYTNAGSDPYTNGATGTMINQNQSNIDAVIGSSNYDIGHVFGTDSGGLAGLGVVCSNGAKARGVTGSSAPVGDPFDIDYVCHEMGHQFNANHTQNNSCNRNNATAVEPGSASTIMGYAGICAPNVQSNSDDHFHGISLEEIDALITSGSHTCPTTTPLANNAPSITSTAGNVTIPANTPFALTAVATDPDGDPLSYCWEQTDNDVTTQPPVATATGGPNFRSNSPTSDPTRYFPNLTDLYNGGPFTWEVIPSVDRTMDFRVTVRDNASGGGCNDHEDLTVTVEDNAGPFIVQYPSATGITWNGFDTETVTWDVANTDQAPVSCSNVDIRISTDGGTTWNDLVTNVPNDGSQPVTVPNTPSTTCLVMVICSNGTFFDISDNYFTINALTNDFSLSTSVSNVSVCQGTDGTFSIDVNELGTFTNTVTLAASGLPGGLSASFTPNPVTPGNSASLVISNTGAVAAGSYSFDVEGTSTTGTKTLPLTIDITSSSVSASTLTTPADGATNVGMPVTFNWTNGGVGVMYDIDIATDPGFSSIVENATGLTNETYNATTLSANTTYYWRVNTYNSCASAGYSSTFSFTTESCSITMSTDVPVAISPFGTPTITSTINIGTSAIISDLDVVDLIGTHTYISDLTITLESPAGTVVTLIDQICNTENDFDINFDDGGTPAGSIPCPPVDGNFYQPVDALSAFNGEDQQGTWTLTIVDNANQDGGSLDSWGLNICITPPACTDPDLPTITADASICEGESITLEVLTGNLNDATDWQWYSGSCGGTSEGNGTSISVSPTTTTTYYVRGEGGCVTPGTCETVTITVNPLPNPAINSVPDLCEDAASVTLVGTPVTPAPGTFSGTGVTGSQFDPATAGTGTHTITYDFTDGNGCSNSATTDITVNPLPTPSINSVSDLCETDAAITLVGTPSGGSFSGPGVSGSSFDPSMAGIGSHTISYNYTDGNGCTGTGFTVINVVTSPSIDAGLDVTICNGDPVTLTANNPDGASLSWDNSVTDGVTFFPTSTTTYTVTATIGSCSSQDQVTVTVLDAPSFTVTGTNPLSCGGSDGAIAINGLDPNTTYNISYDDNGVTVGPTSMTTNGAGNLTINGLNAGTYDNFVVENGAGCSGIISTPTILSDPGSPSVDAGPDISVCNGNTVTLTAINPDGASISWDNGVTDGVIFTPTSTTTYTVTADLGGCIATDQVTVFVNSGYNINNSASICQGGVYTFPDGSTATSSTVHTSSFTSSNGCDSIIVTTLTVTPAFNTSETVEICDGDTHTFPDGTTGSTNMTHTSNLIAQGGCDSTVVTTLIVTNLDIDITFANNLLVADQNNATYQWIDCDNGNTPISGATSQTYEITQTGSYACIIALNGCIDTSNCMNVKFTGIDDINIEEVTIYPNPTAHDFTIDFGKVVEVPLLKIMDARGRLVHQRSNLNQNKVNIPLDKEANGMYIVEIVTNSSTHQIKVLKQR